MNDKLVTITAVFKRINVTQMPFRKYHLGNLIIMLPTNHGFDQFFGNLYHLNAEEEPEMGDNYPKRIKIQRKFGPRGVLHTWATDKDDAKVMPRWGKDRKAKNKRHRPFE